MFLIVWLYLSSLYASSPPWAELDAAKAAALRAQQFHAFLQLALPVAFLLPIAFFYRRLAQWMTVLGCLIVFSVLAVIAWRLTAVGNSEFANWVLTYLMLASFVFFFPALLVVGADIAEWTEILGESAVEALSQLPRRREWLFTGLAIAINAGIVVYWVVRAGTFSGWRIDNPWHSLQLADLETVALAAVILAAGLGVMFAILRVFPARSIRGRHFGYFTILALAYLIGGAPLLMDQYAEQDAPPPNRNFRLSHVSPFSIAMAPGWNSKTIINGETLQVVSISPPQGQQGFLEIIRSSIDEKIATLNEIIPFGETFPSTALAFSAPGPDGWARIDTTLTRYGGMMRSWLGITSRSMAPDVARSLGLVTAAGVQVTQVFPDTPATKTGIDTGDIITAVDQKPVNASDFTATIGAMAPGSTLQISLIHDRKEKTISLTLTELPEEQKTKIRFVVWKKSAPFESGRVDPDFNSFYTHVAACNLETLNECLPAVEAMQESWSPAVRTVRRRGAGSLFVGSGWRLQPSPTS